MRVAYIGNFEPEYSTENDVRKAFEYLGHEVIPIQENSFPLRELSKHSYDFLLITSTWDDAIDLDSWISLVKYLVEKEIPTATLHLDTFWGKSRGGRKWWLNPMFYTANIFTADGDYDKEWKLFGKNHTWLPPAVRHDAAHLGKFRKEYAYDVGFAGSNGEGYHEDVWPYRKELLFHLREMCKRNGWSFHNPGGDHPKVDRGEDMNDWYASVKVTVGDSLCLLREKSQYWSDRVPEATGRGGFLIMPEITALREMYNYRLPSYVWNDWQDLEANIRVALENPVEAEAIKKDCQEITAKDHTYVNRVQTILETVGLA